MTFSEFQITYQKALVKECAHSVPEDVVVSVCVQTYQHANYIRECLDGILMQESDFDYEILLGEDASTDGTREICIEYAEQYPERIRLFLHSRENNIAIGGHPTGRFNFMYNLYHARGKYIALCEGDDYWTDKEKLQNQVQLLEEAGDEAFGCFHLVRRHHNRGSDDYWTDQQLDRAKSRYYLEDLFQPWFLGTASLVLRRDRIFIPDWFDQVPSADIALILTSLKDKYLICYPGIASVRRQHSGGVSLNHTGIKKVMDMAVLYDHINKVYNGRYREQIHEALKMEVVSHVSKLREIDLLEQVKAGTVLTTKAHVKAILKKLKRKIRLT